jgi:hypothetical protein
VCNLRCYRRSGELAVVSILFELRAHRSQHTRGLGKHGVVLQLRLPQRRSVASNDDKLGLAGTQALEGRLVTEGDFARLHHKREARVDGVGGSLVLLGCHLCAQGLYS